MDYYLRDLKESDLDDIHAYTSLPEVAKYQTWDPLTYEETEEFVQTLLNRDEDWMYNVIVDADTDNVIGAIQLISDKKNIVEKLNSLSIQNIGAMVLQQM